jgi:hypothetical protein
MRNTTKIIRNDDVSIDTEMEDIKWFCELCDKYGFKAMQCITPIGKTHEIDVRMSNEEIPKDGTIFENKELIEYLKGRQDIIAVHGLYHTHQPTEEEIEMAKKLLEKAGLKPTFFVTPFNEGDYGEEVCGLKVSAKTQRLEDYHQQGIPTDEIVYLHSWRYGKWYKKEDLELCLQRITTALSNEDTTK